MTEETYCNCCKRKITIEEAEACWYCIADLCYECWDEFGHCGHIEAERMNEIARAVQQPFEPAPEASPAAWW